jgi:hypothetical protein
VVVIDEEPGENMQEPGERKRDKWKCGVATGKWPNSRRKSNAFLQ